MRLNQIAILAGIIFSCLLGSVSAQQADIQAEKIDYDAETGRSVFKDNVIIRHKGSTLEGDYVEYNTTTGDALARGNVKLTKEGQVWEGDEVTGNFETGEWDIGPIVSYYEPINIISPDVQQLEPGHIYMTDLVMTTCDPANMEFYTHAKSADIYPEEDIISAQNVTFYLNSVPIFYLPHYNMDLKRGETNFDFLPGYSSRQGPFLLLAYRWYLDEGLDTQTHLDFRGERGIAIGQDLRWYNTEIEGEEDEYGLPIKQGDLYRGEITSYYLNDDSPYRDDEQELRQRADGIDIDDTRWRGKLEHFAKLAGEGNRLWAKVHKMSDEEVTEDFFAKEFRDDPEAENRISLVHNDYDYTASVEVTRQLNDEFFGAVDRTPVVALDVTQIPIGDTDFYYETINEGGYFTKNFSEKEEDETASPKTDYESLRIHTEQSIVHVKKYFGFLNIIPGLAWKGTYYGETLEETFRDEVVPIIRTVTNGVDIATGRFRTNRVSDVSNQGADFRSLFELSLETSFKAFSVIEEGSIGLGRGLRHVVEPYAQLLVRPEPSVVSAKLPQFDDIDELDEETTLVLGARNKWQTRRNNVFYHGIGDARDRVEQEPGESIWDIVDLDTYATLNLDADSEKNEELFKLFNVDLELRPNDNFNLNTRATYNNDLGELETINTALQIVAPDESYAILEHAFRPDTFSTWQLDLILFPENDFSMESYTRYEGEEGALEEQGVMFAYKTDCLGYGIGGSWLNGDFLLNDDGSDEVDEDDYRVWVQVWLLAFPRSRLEMGDR